MATKLSSIKAIASANADNLLTEEDVERGNLYSNLFRDFAVVERARRTQIAAISALSRPHDLVPTKALYTYIYIADGITLKKVEAKTMNPVNPGGGTVDLFVWNSANVSLLSTATFDGTQLTSEWQELPLTATTELLRIENGFIQYGYDILDAGVSGGPIIFRFWV